MLVAFAAHGHLPVVAGKPAEFVTGRAVNRNTWRWAETTDAEENAVGIEERVFKTLAESGAGRLVADYMLACAA